MATRTRKKPPAKKQTTRTHVARPRASWRGPLKFGLVSLPVQAVNAIAREAGDLHFHQLHAKCHRRIRYEKVCPEHGKVDKSEIVSGYEHKKGEYVEIDPAELEALRPESDRALSIDTFVSPEQIDPIYYDGRRYYLLPDGDEAEEAYAVFLQAMESQEKYAIGQLVFSGKETVAVVRPLEHVLVMEMLNYEPEIRKPIDVREAPSGERIAAKKVQLAETLIKSWTEKDFDLGDYKNRRRERTEELIDAKLEGREVVTPPDEEPHDVINLMDAIKQSLSRGKSERNGRSAKPRAKKSPARRRKAS